MMAGKTRNRGKRRAMRIGVERHSKRTNQVGLARLLFRRRPGNGTPTVCSTDKRLGSQSILTLGEERMPDIGILTATMGYNAPPSQVTNIDSGAAEQVISAPSHVQASRGRGCSKQDRSHQVQFRSHIVSVMPPTDRVVWFDQADRTNPTLASQKCYPRHAWLARRRTSEMPRPDPCAISSTTPSICFLILFGCQPHLPVPPDEVTPCTCDRSVVKFPCTTSQPHASARVLLPRPRLPL